MKHKDFFVVLALLFSVSVHAQTFVGSWSGKISFSGNSLHIVFNISENAESGTVCKMDSPDQGVKGIPASIELVSSDSISIRVPNLGIEYIHIEQTISPIVLDDMVDWLKQIQDEQK